MPRGRGGSSKPTMETDNKPKPKPKNARKTYINSTESKESKSKAVDMVEDPSGEHNITMTEIVSIIKTKARQMFEDEIGKECVAVSIDICP